MTRNQTTALAGVTLMAIAAVVMWQGDGDAGPPGTITVSSGVTLKHGLTNGHVCIVVKELTTGHNLTVGRFILDREIYGDSVALDPGWLPMGEPPDRARGHMMFSRTVSETNRYVIEHWGEPL